MATLNVTPNHPVAMHVQTDMPFTHCGSTGEEAISIINSLMIKFIALAKEHARLLQDYHAAQQEMLFKKQMQALETKQEVIDKNFTANILQAAAQMAGGGLSAIGAAFGPAGAAGGTGASAISQGATKIYADCEARDAQMKQLLGDTQTAAAEQTDKGIEKILRQIDEIRKDLDQVQRDAVHIYKQLKDAIKLAG